MTDEDPRFHAAGLVLALRQVGVTDHRVTEALEKTPREPFVPRPFLDSAWENVELPIDCGQTLTRRVDHACGNVNNPMSDEQVETKYHNQADPVLGRERAAALLRWCWGLERAAKLDALTELMEVRR